MAFSSDNKNLAITYQVITENGIKYRIRYFNEVGCKNKNQSEFDPLEFEEYVQLTKKHQDKLTKDFDDLYRDITTYFTALTVSQNKLAYSLLYDTNKFHLLEKNPVTKTWQEKQGSPVVMRNNNLYEFCLDLYLVEKNNAAMLITQSFLGNSLDNLTKDINIYEMLNLANNYSPNLPIIPTYNAYVLERKTFSSLLNFPSIESVHNLVSHFLVSKDKGKMLVSRNNDGTIIIPLPFENSETSFQLKTLEDQEIREFFVGTNNLSLVVDYSAKTNCLYFHVIEDEFVKKVQHKEMCLSQLSKPLWSKKVIGILLFSPDDFNIANNKL